ncbi:Guanine nucleotide exchange factor lte1 [Rhizina undulata]
MDESTSAMQSESAPNDPPRNHHSPRRRDGNASISATTPQASPERNTRNTAPNLPIMKPSFERPRTKNTTSMGATFNASTNTSSYVQRGHQFTVGNISNGFIYLRPVVRPPLDLHQDFFFPPSTPPSSAEERAGKCWRNRREEHDGNVINEKLPLTPPPPKTPPRGTSTILSDDFFSKPYLNSSPPIERTRHNRAHSYSTLNEPVSTAKESDFGGFRVRIDQVDGPDGERPRPRTAGHSNNFQSLDIQIPRYNLGSPHFSPNGTPFLYGASSLHLPSVQGELGSPSVLSQQTDVRWLWPGVESRLISSHSILDPDMPVPDVPTSTMSSSAPQTSTPLSPVISIDKPSINPSAHSPLHPKITPKMYDSLSFPPASEDPAIVRYDSQSREIIAAIPARIIAQITSATFVDYHLLSDFFLTFRLFMAASDLVAYLISRLRWAVERADDTGKVVRVRTFVAIRHWLLNYFADDFLPSLPLREEFATAMNELSTAVQAKGNLSDMKIIDELKKCWRRTCALYWDNVGTEEVGVENEIFPGGSAGSRDESGGSSSTFLRRPRSPPPRLESVRPEHSSGTESFIRDVIQAPTATKGSTGGNTAAILRPLSSASTIEAHSTSLPCFSSPRMESSSHPPQSSQSSRSIPKSKASKEFVTKKGASVSNSAIKKLRTASHKRSGSFSDALRDDRQPLPLQKSIARSTHLLMAFPYAGSLVRGSLYPPTPAFVEVIAPSTPIDELAGFSIGVDSSSGTSSSMMFGSPGKHYPHLSGVKAGPGMKKFLGNFKKALGSKVPPEEGGAGMNITVAPGGSPHGKFTGGSTSDGLSMASFLVASESRGALGILSDGKPARIDLLGAGVVEAFQRAMQEETETGESIAPIAEMKIPGCEEEGKSDNEIPLDGAVDGRTDVKTDPGSDFNNNEEVSAMEGHTTSSSSFPMRSDSVTQTKPILHRPSENWGSRKLLRRIHDFPERPPRPPSSVFSSSSRPVRRSKSFSFERMSSRFNPSRESSINMPLHGTEGRSLQSARSFTVNRTKARISIHSSDIDDISEPYSQQSSFVYNKGNFSPPKRLLRRKPGGDLRAATTVGDLEIPRPKSAGSVETGRFSLAGSFRLSNFRREASPLRKKHSFYMNAAPVASLGAVVQGGVVSFTPPVDPEACTSVPEYPPSIDPKASFEAGVHNLRYLPDCESDDGGVEVALMKLEGTYKRTTSVGMAQLENESTDNLEKCDESQVSLTPSIEKELEDRAMDLDGAADDGNDQSRRLQQRNRQILDNAAIPTPPILDAASEGHVNENNRSSRGTLSRGQSGDSTPIIERGISINNFRFRQTEISNKSVPILEREAPYSLGSAPEHGLSPRPSPNDIALQRLDSDLAKHVELSEDLDRDDASDLSSEISFDIASSEISGQSKFPPIQSGTIIAELGIPCHPLRHPPSPPLTLEQALTLPPEEENHLKPRTQAPDHNQSGSPRSSAKSLQESQATPRQPPRTDPEIPMRPTSLHLPFILAYDSELLAKQFTLIEKDALMDVDWKELVELRWKQTTRTVRDWVEFLNAKDIRGVEMVIARFNLMCKWARSEIVMTKDMEERARTVIKFIHIAAHARRLQNYATMYQLTIALLTADITRLHKTWALVSPVDMATFREMEALVQPVRNFHNLRSEMDKVTGESGCIPFVGIFTHDLILTSQRPAFLVGESPNTEPLVNFERHRTTAAIVKRLLRLIEASHKYDFKAVDGVCERCLWIASLTDDEIRALSRTLE